MTDILTTPIDPTSLPVPEGWQRGKTKESNIIYRPLEGFTFAEVRYEPNGDDYDYALYWVDVEGPGPYVQRKLAIYADIDQAVQAGNKL